ncbi:MAG: divergent PAP2 family protein [Clostridiales bacterium]|nr:divergent PAP2 family protein [Clostridiales bacterium]
MTVINELGANKILWASIFSCFLAQFIKVAIDIIRYKSLNVALFISTGGMPSSHSSLVTTMAAMIGFGQGFDSPVFALAAVISLVVMYDAAGVRRAAGKQAEVLNLLLTKLETNGVLIDKKLKELLGHSPVEVACGALLGVAVALVFDGL